METLDLGLTLGLTLAVLEQRVVQTTQDVDTLAQFANIVDGCKASVTLAPHFTGRWNG